MILALMNGVLTTKKLRILHLSPFKQYISGSDESLVDMISHLKVMGMESVVALPKASPYAARYAQAGARLVHLPLSSIKRTFRPDRWIGFVLGFAAGLTALRTLLKSNAIHIVHTNMETAPAGAMAAKSAGIPSIIHVRSTSIRNPRWAFRLFMRFLIAHADLAIAISDAVYNLMREEGFPEDRLRRIYDPVDVERYRPRSEEEISALTEEKLGPLGLPEGARLIGLIGRMNPIKGQDVFIEAGALIARRHKDVHFLFVGSAAGKAETRYEEGLRIKARRLGMDGRTHFLGFRSDVESILPLLAASVSPSTTEAFGRPAVEAMSCGVPAIVAATDGLKETVIDGETGFHLAARNPEALADAMDKILCDPHRAREMGRRGRERVIANFSSAIHAEKMRNIFQESMNYEKN